MSSDLILPRVAALRVVALLPAALLAQSLAGMNAQAAEPGAADRAAIAACINHVKKNQAAHGADETAEKPGPAGRLAAARAEAARKEESCIGVVATACIQAAGDESNATMIQCYGREADAWDGRLNAAYKALLAKGEEQDVADGLRKTQRAWIVFRDAACAQPALAFKGTMAGPLSAWCVMDKTARQALWLEGWQE